MRPLIALIRREFAAYFQSPIAYVVLGVFLTVTGHLFYLATLKLTETTSAGTEYPMQEILGSERFWLVFLFIPPLLTMRSFAEERGSGTLEMLMTAPIRDGQVVLGKFLACFAFYKLMWLPTLVYLPVLLDLHSSWDTEAGFTPMSITLIAGLGLMLVALLVLLPLGGSLGWVFGVLLLGALAAGVGGWGHYARDPSRLLEVRCGIDPWPVLTSYLGVYLAGGMFLALGMFVSSLVKSQMVAAMLAMILSLFFIVAGVWQLQLDTGGWTYRVLYFVSVPLHFARDFTRGVVDTRQVVFYLSLTLFCLFLTVRSLENRRWK